jgi:hypothetical protein
MARQTPGNYVPLDVNYARDIAVRKAGTNAELLYIRSLAYAKGARTSGFVSDFDLEVVAVGMRAVKATAERLVEVGLWVRVEDGWLIRSWERWNAGDRVVSAGGKLGNHKRWHVDRGEVDPECEHCTDQPPIAPRSHPDSPPISPPESQGKGREGKGTTTAKAVVAPRKRASQAPQDFEITDNLREWAQAKAPGVDLARETERFLDHHRAKGSTFKDWAAAWRTWMSRATQYGTNVTPLRTANGGRPAYATHHRGDGQIPHWEL